MAEEGHIRSSTSTGEDTFVVMEGSASFPCGQHLPSSETMDTGISPSQDTREVVIQSVETISQEPTNQTSDNTPGPSTSWRKRKSVIESDTDSEHEQGQGQIKRKKQLKNLPEGESDSDIVIELIYKDVYRMNNVDKLIDPYIVADLPIVHRRMLSVASVLISDILDLRLSLKLIVRKLIDLRRVEYLTLIRSFTKHEVTKLLVHILERVLCARLSSVTILENFDAAWNILIKNQPFIIPVDRQVHETPLCTYYEYLISRIVIGISLIVSDQSSIFHAFNMDSLSINNDAILIGSWYLQYVMKGHAKDRFLLHVWDNYNDTWSK